MEYIQYNGQKFVKDKRTGYYLSSTPINNKRLRLHRYIWELHKGDIPSNHEIHHKDKNKDNNDIENLVCISQEYHRYLHARDIPETQLKNFQEAGTEAAKAWHKSSEGQEWHRQHALNTWEDREYTCKECEVCGKSYQTPFPTRSKYCGNNCKARALRKRNKNKVNNL